MAMVINLYFGYAFYMAGLLRWTGVKNFEGELISGGETITIIFIIIISVTSLAGAGNNMPAISGARVAGKFAFDVIDAVPSVQPNEPGSMVLKREDVKGKIEFDNVCFNYPSNPDLKVLKNLSVTFEAGQTIGLIGPSGSGKSTII